MEKQISVAKFENSILPGFRNKINKAESVEDVRNFFIYTARELLVNIFQDNKYQHYDIIEFSANKEPHYKINKSFIPMKEFNSVWNNSDLPRVVERLAEAAMHRYQHLGKKTAKTTSKIRN